MVLFDMTHVQMTAFRAVSHCRLGYVQVRFGRHTTTPYRVCLLALLTREQNTAAIAMFKAMQVTICHVKGSTRQ